MKILHSLALVLIFVSHSASAMTGWVCSETDSSQVAGFPSTTEIKKYAIAGNQLKTILDSTTIIEGMQLDPAITYQIVTNNALGLVAISTDVKQYNTGPEVWADIIEIDKARSLIRHFSGSTAGRQEDAATGPCTSFELIPLIPSRRRGS
jgi:hypothetical protein